jgi:SAM-dependent methyltransferase
VADADALLKRPVPPPMAALFQQQIADPKTEYDLALATPELTEIDDEVSVAVRRQYEENPYPTWVKIPPAKPLLFDERMRLQFPGSSYRPLEKSDLDILIAGCGTGQHSIDTAQMHPQARVLAIDLSLASLGYAQRKTRELGVGNLDYGHADILKTRDLKRTFDVIESSGVLHHLNDPWEGWRVLLSLLRPNGVMRIGLYSWYAREHIRNARDFIAKGGYQSTPDGIRTCRQAVMASKEESLRWAAQSPDFFTTSACRDLLFHVQEHQHTWPEIKKFIDENGLTLLGLDNLPARLLADYRKQFPDDASMTNLDNWHTFETQHPHLFGGMYQFWLQKRR